MFAFYPYNGVYRLLHGGSNLGVKYSWATVLDPFELLSGTWKECLFYYQVCVRLLSSKDACKEFSFFRMTYPGF